MAAQVLLQILNGFVWGWILALISLGLSLIFGLLQIINIAHGTLYMLGAVLAWTIIATFALLLIFQQVVLLTFGGAGRMVPEPVQFRLSFGDFGYSGYRILVAAFAIIILFGTWAFLHKTRAGLWIRAVKQDKEMALALGIPVTTVYTLSLIHI